MGDLEISCVCGELQGVIRETGPRYGERVLCYCRDCQAAAHHLGHPETLDEWGGTDLFITTPARMEFSSGSEQLACFRFSPNGPRRWYTKCCNTHISNGFQDPAVPFVSLNLACTTANSRPLVGAAARGMLVRDAHGCPTVPVKVQKKSRRVEVGALFRVVTATLRGLRGRSPFMKNGEPIAEAELLGREARSAALAKAGF